MRQHIGRLVLMTASIIMIAVLLYTEYTKEGISEERKLYISLGEETIQTWENDGVFYLFLPAGISLQELRLAAYSQEFYIQASGKRMRRGEGLEELVKDQQIKCRFADSGQEFLLCVMQSENIASVFVDTSTGGIEELKADKEYRVSGTVHVLTADGDWEKKLALKAIGGRGNTSFAGYEKKPFSITLKDEASICGLPAGRKYALISNASDPSLIRNDLVRRMEEAMELSYSHAGKFADLYVNGQYEGAYYLCDYIEIGAERISVDNMENTMNLIYNERDYEAAPVYETDTLKARRIQVDQTDITGGYLVEREYSQRFRQEYEELQSTFITGSGEHFVVKNPQYCSVEQIEYISAYVDAAEQAILSRDGIHPQTQKHYSEYIDLDSFVKKYLAEEVSKNYDAGVSSSYFYKDSDVNGGKLCAGPGWDYDMSLGNYVEWMKEFSADPTGISELAFHTYASSWYTELYDKPDFYQLVEEYYCGSVEPFLRELLNGGLERYEDMLSASARMNEVRWYEELAGNSCYENRRQTFRELKDFITERKKYLDGVWME